MALDTRWKEPQGKTPEQLYDAISQIVRELRKGAFLSGVENPDADGVPYDNTASGLTADNVQDAIDEVEGRVDDLEALPASGLVLLNSGTVTNAAQLDIVLTSFTAYRGLLFKLSNFIPASDAAFRIRLSTDGGGNFDAGASDYAWAILWHRAGNVSGTTGDNADDALDISGNGTIESTASGITVSVEIMNQTSTARAPMVTAQGVLTTTDPDVAVFHFAGRRLAAQNTDAVRFLFSSGNIASGSWALYGYA